ncbi:exocyst complex component exo70 [Umbelopsis sp. WA50703]
MDPAQIKRLSQLSTYLSTSESELGYAVDFTKPYIEIRSAYLSKSMHNISQIAAADRQSGVYERGAAEFLRYMGFLTKMFTFEYDLATRLLSNPVHRTAALKGTFAPALTDFIAAGKAINAHIRRSSYQDVFMILDILERYESECNSVLEKILPRKEMDTILELMTALRGTALRSIYDFMEDVKGRKDPANPNLSNDGTVHELTSNTLSHLKRLWGWNDIVEPVLLILGNDGWNTPVTAVAEQQPLSLKSTPEGRSLLKSFFVDVLDQLNNTLQAKSKSYRKPALAVIFLLNNYNHVLRQIRSPPLNAIFDEGREARFGKLVRRQMDAYQETWKPCIENLMDVTYVRGGAIKQTLGNNEKQQIKDKFRTFNLSFEDIWRTQKTYAIPDSELRFAIIRDVKNVLLPMYSRFIEKYQGTDFTKNTAKYIRWDKDQLDRMLNQLFEPAA